MSEHIHFRTGNNIFAKLPSENKEYKILENKNECCNYIQNISKLQYIISIFWWRGFDTL